MTREELLMHARALYECSLTPENVKSAIEKEFPELKESEDERIRKELLEEIEFIIPHDDETDSEGLILPSYHARIDRYKSYLEKHKEPKPVEWEWPNLSNCIKNCKKCQGKCFYRKEPYEEQKPAEKLSKEEYVKKFKALCDAYEIKLPNREYDIYGLCEDLHKLFGDIQNPAEWSEDTIRKAIEEVGLTQHQINWFKNNVFPPKQEWSEEDKVMLNNIIWSVHMKSIIKPLDEMDDRSRYKKYEDFLKALPERFNLQPKQESEPIEIKYAGKNYKVYGTKELPGGVIGYIIEDEPGHYDCIIHPDEVLGGGYGIKSNGSPYPTKEITSDEKFAEYIEDSAHLGSSVTTNGSEWSEEDEKMLTSFLHKVEVCDLLTNKENVWIVKRLKALRPQPHTVEIKDATNFGNLEYERGVKDGIQSEKSRQWKPSKKQMKALEASCSVLKTHDTWGEDEHLPILMSLISDLQKLL